MKTKIIALLFLFTFLTIPKTNAQTLDTNLQNGISEFISWITNLEDQVNDIYKAQNKNKLIRQLGYIGSDLDYLASEKGRLADRVIEIHKSEEPAVSIEILSEYTMGIDNLNHNISKLIILLNDQYQVEGNKILDKIRYDLNSRKVVELRNISEMLSGETEFDEARIRESAERAKGLALNARDSVFELRKILLKE